MTGVVQSHLAALSSRAALVPLQRQAAYRLLGEAVTQALDHLLATRLADGGACRLQRVLWCFDDGTVIGDGLLYALEPRQYLLFTPVRCLAWLEDSLAPFGVTVQDTSHLFAGVTLAGPLGRDILRAADVTAVSALEEGHGRALMAQGLGLVAGHRSVRGIPAFDLWTAPASLDALQRLLLRAGEIFGLVAADASVREVLRIEAGEPLAHVDYSPALTAVPARRAVFPADIGLEALVDLSKPAFIGRQALLAPRREHPRLVRLGIEGASDASAGCRVLARGRVCGYITSAAYAPRLGLTLALAWLEGSVDPESLAVALPATPEHGAAPRLAKARFFPGHEGGGMGPMGNAIEVQNSLGRRSRPPGPAVRGVVLKDGWFWTRRNRSAPAFSDQER